MSESKKTSTRRAFFRQAGVVALASTGVAASCRRLQSVDAQRPEPAPEPSSQQASAQAASSRPTQAGARAKVVLVRDQDVLKEGRKVDAEVMARMLDQGMAELFDLPASEAWAKLFGAADTVGIKTNIWRFLRTPPELEETIVQRLQGAGVKAERIGVDDRGVRSNPLFAEATALINVRPMRTHHWAGVGSLIKNYIMFSAVPFSWHADSCANLAGVWELPEVKGKTRLNILVMLTPLFHGKGPHHYQAQYTWAYNGLLLGTDPVAVDATGLRILEAKRHEHFGAESPLSVSPKHIWVAEQKYGIGVADPARIEVKKVGWSDGALI